MILHEGRQAGQRARCDDTACARAQHSAMAPPLRPLTHDFAWSTVVQKITKNHSQDNWFFKLFLEPFCAFKFAW
jgi:hypothetical protein